MSENTLPSYRSQTKHATIEKQTCANTTRLCLMFHVPEPYSHHLCSTLLRGCEFRNQYKPLVFTISSRHWFTKSMRTKTIKHDTKYDPSELQRIIPSRTYQCFVVQRSNAPANKQEITTFKTPPATTKDPGPPREPKALQGPQRRPKHHPDTPGHLPGTPIDSPS